MTLDFEYNKALIDVLNNKIPKKSDQMSLILEKMPIGREAAYRRLRGDVPFSFAEACILSKELNVSLDKIATTGTLNNPVYELKISPSDLINYEYHKLFEHEASFDMLLSDSVVCIQSVCSTIPYSFFFSYKHLSKYRMFRWKYQMNKSLTPIKLSDIVIPPEIIERQKALGKKVMQMPETILIFDNYIFFNFIHEVRFFYNLGLITDDEYVEIKEELVELIKSLENVANQGKNDKGVKAWMYISNIKIDSNYTYVQGVDFECAYMDGIYLMDTLYSCDSQICQIHKLWIDTLRKYSVLISVSDEAERKSFFKLQKEMILNLE
ncbi:hypothetical protein D0T53_12335 [Dysgonomonas sp. 216]|uniref:hypothetical protein n=1 Tax=Dysgonomonas sp. 216 TaxID=2302934 RepID=UPI0013D80F49|nr:hypothetical protein [Dysgonomonas sp. 216]NDW19692.1 hypothetical protein [Dysgonomonas sp. 216]